MREALVNLRSPYKNVRFWITTGLNLNWPERRVLMIYAAIGFDVGVPGGRPAVCIFTGELAGKAHDVSKASRLSIVAHDNLGGVALVYSCYDLAPLVGLGLVYINAQLASDLPRNPAHLLSFLNYSTV